MGSQIKTPQLTPLNWLWIAVFMAVLVWSGIAPKDYLIWLLEVSPAIIGGLILLFTRRVFPLTPLLYALILMHCVVLMVGGHYTYAEVPWFENLGNSGRNNYDKVGHVMQGFVPAIIAREMLLRLNVVESNGWRNFFIVSICLALSAFYELIEWLAALLSETAAESFLGTQGYVWDTQSDMAYALGAAIIALLLLSRWHDRQLTTMRS